jgi:hypothetical protein
LIVQALAEQGLCMYDEDDEKRFPRITLWQFLRGIVWRGFVLIELPDWAFARWFAKTFSPQEPDKDAEKSKSPPADTPTRHSG